MDQSARRSVRVEQRDYSREASQFDLSSERRFVLDDLVGFDQNEFQNKIERSVERIGCVEVDLL